MPGKPDKPHRIRVRVLDGKPREPNKLKGQLVPHVDVVDMKDKVEFVICAVKEAHLEQVRARLGAAGLEEIPGGDTSVAAPAERRPVPPPRHGSGGTPYRGGPEQRGRPRHQQGRAAPATATPDLRKKPYGFVALPENFTTDAPIWHDGTSSKGKLSGEIRCELATLTPLLVGWERRVAGGDQDESWPLAEVLDGVGKLPAKKAVLCPLRAPWGARPVIIPGDSLKGLLRHELGALLGAPMERVAERSYSYRPNALYPKAPGAYLVPRLARVPRDGVQLKPLGPAVDQPQVRVPKRLELLPVALKYDKNGTETSNYYRFDDAGGAPYRGGQGAGEKLNSTRKLHKTVTANPSMPTEPVDVPVEVQEGYLATLRHLTDLDHGHFSQRHPDVPTVVTGDDARNRILTAATNEAFQPGDLIWVEWDTKKKHIVSLGWHYYYRWAYTDSVRCKSGRQREDLFPLPNECERDADGAPVGLSAVRRLFGYTGGNDGGNDGSKGIRKDDHEQLMGRLFPNAAIEVIEPGDNEESRFLEPTFLKELGMPRPSAVEFYLKQPHHPQSRPSDRAKLVTYGDAAGYDAGGDLAGRKFYLDRKDAYTSEPWKDDSDENKKNDRSTLALEASKPGRRFRFTLRFRDLDPAELAAVLVALCPHQFGAVLGGDHADGYCSKLGYGRPLGWGSVRIEAKALLWLDSASAKPALVAVPDISAWVRDNFGSTALLSEWLAVHRHKHPDAADYPRLDGEIYTYHTKLRAEHSRARRYRREGGS